jgi:hypothetical protein
VIFNRYSSSIASLLATHHLDRPKKKPKAFSSPQDDMLAVALNATPDRQRAKRPDFLRIP